jgi:hypothetical protein
MVGIIRLMLGSCLLFLFINLDAHQRVKRAHVLHDAVTTMLLDDEIHCDKCPLHKETNVKGICQMKLLEEAKEKPLAVEYALSWKGRQCYVCTVPVIKGNDMEAVLEF